jgi:hypothetical protein
MTATQPATSLQARIREASFSDYDQIAAVMARNELMPRPRGAWTALWKGNPAFESGAKRPIGWVLEAEGRLAGCVANVPRNYAFHGRLIRGVAECDWAVDKMYRGYALALWQRLTRQPNVELLLSTTVGAASEPTYAAYQWSRVPVGQWDKAGFWVGRYCGFLRSALRRKAVPLATPLVYPLAATLFCRDRLLCGNPTEGRLAVEWRADFDKSFDVFWRDLQREKKDVLLAVRDCDTLRWQFQPGQARQSTWIAGASKGSRLLAYAIFVRRDHPRSGLRRVRLADFQALENPAEAFRSILSRAIARCRVEDIHMLEDIGCLAERLGCPAPHHRRLEAWAYYYKAVRADLSRALTDPGHWEPTSFEGDLSL